MFLQKLLPDEGMYCVAMLLSSGGFRHYFHTTLDAAEKQLHAFDQQGYTVYMAQATFDKERIDEALAHNEQRNGKRMGERTQDNAMYLRNFFLDIDVGEKWPLKTQKEAAEELKKFIADTKLPFPSVVSSGNGLYAHWILDEAIPARQWKTIAEILKRVVHEHSPALAADSSRTSDSASVLRAPGTNNRKNGVEKPVSLLKDTEPLKFQDFVDAVQKLAKKKKIDISKTLPPVANDDINAEFYAYQGPKADANKIADKCAQIGHLREKKCDESEDIDHTTWFLLLGVLMYCEGGVELAYEWTSNHPSRNADKTPKVVSQWLDRDVGPATCARIGGARPEHCIGCPYNGKIKSPIMLGSAEIAPITDEDGEVDAPEKFIRSEKGLFAKIDDIDVQFYDQDLYVSALALDESLGCEVMTIKHNMPYEGAMEFNIRSSLVTDPKALMSALADNHITVVGAKEKKLMVGYLESYKARLQRKRRMSRLLCQMGWKEAQNKKPIFVLGKKIFHADGTVDVASLAKNVPKAVEAFHSKGSLDKWTKMTEIFNKPGMEPFAFALLTSFGAPLMQFTGFRGALVSMVGGSGAGKTLLQNIGLSVWGYHNDLMMLRDDTKNALVSRLGVYGNLPLCVDEVTNIQGMDLSELVYQVTQGREKVRLTKNSEERKVLNNWNTIALSSSNSSLIDKLSELKHDATAEINRVFEYPVKKHPEFQGQITEDIYWTIHENYGYAGERYAQYLVANMDKIQGALKKIRENIETTSGLKGEERFWGAVVSAACLGGYIAAKLGLLEFDIKPVMEWASTMIRSMRGDKRDLASDAVSILAQYLDDHASNRLVVKMGDRADNRGPAVIVEQPRGPLTVRYELDNHTMYISRSSFKAWLSKRFGSYTQVKNELLEMKALKNANLRKTLGANTVYGGAQQVVWQLNMKARGLGDKAMNMRQVAEKLAEAGTETLPANQVDFRGSGI